MGGHMGHWATKKVVVRDFYISFKPMGSEPTGKTVDLSDPITNQASDEAIYVAVTGRPAGLWNFIREHIGLSRRFEFVMSSNQCIQRLGSPTTQILSSSQMNGLNTVTVGLVRPLVQAILLTLLSLILVIAASYEPDLTGLSSSALMEEPSAIWTAISGLLIILNMMLLGIASAWAWFVLALALGIYAAYLFFIDKRNIVTVSESGNDVVGFIVSPSFLESQSTDIPLEHLNRLPMIFHVLKK